jgi:hypothetical protein
MISREINIITGEEKIINLTSEQIEQKNKNEIEHQKIVQAEADKEIKKASGKQKLLDLGLTEEEVKALIGV